MLSPELSFRGQYQNLSLQQSDGLPYTPHRVSFMYKNANKFGRTSPAPEGAFQSLPTLIFKISQILHAL